MNANLKESQVNKSNPTGMFADDLKELAQLEAAAKPLAQSIDEQIEALKDIRFKIMLPSIEKREAIKDQATAILEAADNNKATEKLIKANMHHLLTFSKTTQFTYNEEAARDYIIENKL